MPEINNRTKASGSTNHTVDSASIEHKTPTLDESMKELNNKSTSSTSDGSSSPITSSNSEPTATSVAEKPKETKVNATVEEVVKQPSETKVNTPTVEVANTSKDTATVVSTPEIKKEVVEKTTNKLVETITEVGDTDFKKTFIALVAGIIVGAIITALTL